jgi:hypothetical protein
MHGSIAELWSAMSPIAEAVIAVLASMSLVSTTLAIEKLLRLRRRDAAARRFLVAWRGALAEGGVAAAAARDRHHRHPRAPRSPRTLETRRATLKVPTGLPRTRWSWCSSSNEAAGPSAAANGDLSVRRIVPRRRY